MKLTNPAPFAFVAVATIAFLEACAPAAAPPPETPKASVAPATDTSPSITTTVAAPIAQPLPEGTKWVEAALKNAETTTELQSRGLGSVRVPEVVSAWREWFRAVRETGVQGADLVAAADKYRDHVVHFRELFNAQYKSAQISANDLIASEVALSEADYWVAWAHNHK